MATERELELAKQILAKLTEMDTKLARIEDSVGELNGKETSTSVEGKLDDLKSVHTGIKATFEKGLADIHNGLDEINKNRWEGKKQRGQLN
ncbi:TPA: chromosome segregation protein SMC [Bacillus cereus]|nr:chromosome segregation protein SMC [Bacillus cereus]